MGGGFGVTPNSDLGGSDLGGTELWGGPREGSLALEPLRLPFERAMGRRGWGAEWGFGVGVGLPPKWGNGGPGGGPGEVMWRERSCSSRRPMGESGEGGGALVGHGGALVGWEVALMGLEVTLGCGVAVVGQEVAVVGLEVVPVGWEVTLVGQRVALMGWEVTLVGRRVALMGQEVVAV